MISQCLNQSFASFCAFVMSSRSQSISPIQWLLSQTCNEEQPAAHFKGGDISKDICNCLLPTLPPVDLSGCKNIQISESDITRSSKDCQEFLINPVVFHPYNLGEFYSESHEEKVSISKEGLENFHCESEFQLNCCDILDPSKVFTYLAPCNYFRDHTNNSDQGDSLSSSNFQDRMVAKSLGNSKCTVQQKADRDTTTSTHQASVNSRQRNKHKHSHKSDHPKLKTHETKNHPRSEGTEDCTDTARNCQAKLSEVKDIPDSSGQLNSKESSTHCLTSSPLQEVGHILESSLPKHSSKNEKESFNPGDVQEAEKDGSDTGYSSRCSTPPAPLLPNNQPAEEEKKILPLMVENKGTEKPLDLQSLDSRRSPSLSEGSISSLGSDDSDKGQKFPHCNAPNQANCQLTYSRGVRGNKPNVQQFCFTNLTAQNNFINRYNGNMKPLVFFSNQRNNDGTNGMYHSYRKVNNRTPHPQYRHFNPNYNRVNYPSQMLNSRNGGGGHNMTNHPKRNGHYGNWNPNYKNRNQWNPSHGNEHHHHNKHNNGAFWKQQNASTPPPSLQHTSKGFREGEGKKILDPSGTFIVGKGNPDGRWQVDHRTEATSQPLQLLVGSNWDSLSLQVWNMFASNQQLDSTFRAKMKLKECISKVVWNILPTCRLFVVGSSLSGFGANSSDVDMCLMVTPRDLDQRTEAQAVLRLLQGELNNCGFVEKMDLIKARVPILKFRDTYTSIDVDLNCNNSVGIRNTHLLNAYSQLDWRVRPLVLVVKLWAQHHHINNAKDMTISSYSLVLMVLHYLQCGVQPALIPCLHKIFPEKFNFTNHVFKMPVTERMPPFTSNNRQTLGELFLGFLDYFANKFTFIENTISVRTGGLLSSEECRFVRTKKNDSRMWKYLCIEEPFDLTNTAKSVYDEIVFEKVKNVFKESYFLLREKRDLTSIFQKKSA